METPVIGFVGFAVGLLEMGAGVPGLVWEIRMDFWMVLSTQLSSSCLCAACWIPLTRMFGVPFCAKSSAQWFEQEGVCVHLAHQGGLEVDQLIAQGGVAANRVSVSSESVASMSVWMTDCHAVHGVAACRCSADPTPKSLLRNGR